MHLSVITEFDLKKLNSVIFLLKTLINLLTMGDCGYIIGARWGEFP